LAASNQIPSSQNVEIPFECLQPSLNEALKRAKPESGDNGASDKVSCFTAPTSARPSRMITFSGDLQVPNPILHTPIFFSRAITAAKTAVLAAQKRAKKKRFQALLLASSLTNHGTNRWTPVQNIKPEVSTLDISPSALSTAEGTINRCAEHPMTPPTYPGCTVPIRTEMQEPTALTYPEGLTGSDSDQAGESSVAYVHSGMEKYTAEPMLEDTLEDPTCGDASPSVGKDANDTQRNLAESVTLNSLAMISARPVLQSPSADGLSVDESNNEANLDDSRISSGESDTGQPDYLPTASQFKASRSISEIPEKTRSSAQCLIQVLNDIKVSKKFG
jgi:hypothetical protein